MGFDVERLYDRRADNRWERVSVGDVFERMTWSFPDKEVLIATPDAIAEEAFARVTNRQADEIANRVANRLLAGGLQRGDRVALFCENSVEAFLTKIGVAKAGGVVVPINTMMAPDMVEHVLSHVEPVTAIVDADLWERCAPMFATAGVTPQAYIVGAAEGPPDCRPFGEWIASADTAEPDVRIHGDDIWEILMTSGTTSMPKAVMLSHHATMYAGMAHAMSYSRGVPVESDMRSGSFLPVIFHIADQAHVFGPFVTGGSVVIGKRPEPAAIARAVTEERITSLWGGSPAFIGQISAAVDADPEAYDLTSLTVIVYGWTALDPALVDHLQEQCDGVEMVGIFGQTEAIACHRWYPVQQDEVHRATAPQLNYVGVPVALLGATLVDPDGESLHDRPGVLGEAVYRSPVMTAGYFRDEAATREAFRDGWFHSGDVCSYDENGLRVMLDRSKDIVKSGGENVSSIRVEGMLARHPSVNRAAVVGIPDEHWGEAVTGCVVLEEGAELDEAALIAYCRERLAGYETPKRIVAMDDLPATVGGKVLKYKLRESLRDPGDRSRDLSGSLREPPPSE